MKMVFNTRDFSGTTIKTAFDQMRANAVINAQHDTRGLSVISFNISAFIQDARYDDAYFLLNKWAVAPIIRSPSKFKRYPRAGHDALYKRAITLAQDLSDKRLIPYWFVESIMKQMNEQITDHYARLCPDYVHAAAPSQKTKSRNKA